MGTGRQRVNIWLKALLILALVMMVVSGPFGCSCGGALVATGQGVLEAIEALDAQRMATYFIEDIREEVTSSMGLVFAIVDSVRLYNVEWEVLSQTEERATVEIGVDWEATAFDETRSGRANESIDLMNVDGEWLISDFSPFEWLLEELLTFESH
jgi:hypothetical protein